MQHFSKLSTAAQIASEYPDQLPSEYSIYEQDNEEDVAYIDNLKHLLVFRGPLSDFLSTDYFYDNISLYFPKGLFKDVFKSFRTILTECYLAESKKEYIRNLQRETNVFVIKN